MKKILKIWLGISVFLFSGAFSQIKADNLYLSPLTLNAGGTSEIVFNLNNTISYYGFQLDVTLPQGVTPYLTGNSPTVTLSNRLGNSYQVYSDVISNGDLRIMAFSSGNVPISGTTGQIFTLKVNVASSFTGGMVKVTNIKFVDSTNNDVKLPDVTLSTSVAVPGTRDKLYIDPFEIDSGETKELSVLLTNQTQFTAFQTQLELPSSLQLVSGSITLSGRDKSHSLSSRTNGNVTQIIVSSNSNAVISGNSGAILTFSVKAIGNEDTGVIKLKNNYFTATDLQEYKLEDADCNFSIIASIPATSITLSPQNLKLFVGTSKALQATINPTNATDKEISWVSQTPGIATVSETGVVTAVSKGTTTVTATCGEVSATCDVSVYGAGDIGVNPGDGTSEGNDGNTPAENTNSGMSLNGKDLTLRVGQSGKVKLQLPADLTEIPTFEWSLANGGNSYVTLQLGSNDTEASFTGVNMGNTKYYVKIQGESTPVVEGNITVIARNPMTSLTLEPTQISIPKNGSPVTVTAKYGPNNADASLLAWSNSTSGVVTMTTSSQTTVSVTPQNTGQTVITVKANDGSDLSAQCTVNVTAPVDDNFELDFSDAAMGGVDGLTIYIGDTYQLKPKAQEGHVLPDNISWSSDNSSIVSVDSNGLIRGNALGTATITASAVVNGKTVSATCMVTVIAVTASSITLSAENLKLFVGQSAELTATVTPANTTNPQITWKTDNSAVATVTSEGKVVGVKAGTANITATCGTATATCVVTVMGNENVVVKPGDGTTEGDDRDTPAGNTDNGGSLIGNDLTLRVGQTAGIKVELPADLANNPTLTWTLATGGEQYVSMTPDANTLGATFKGLAMGKTSYSISIEGQVMTGGNVTVIAEHPMTSLRLNPESIEMAQNAPAVKITPEYTPSNASYTQLTWTSSNPNVATVSNDGTVTPVGQGETVITATANDGSLLSANCYVKVTVPVDENFDFDFSDVAMGGVDGLTIYIGDTYQLKPKAQEGHVLPDNISWSSDNSSIVSVDSNGLIRGKALGTATITASATVNGKTVQATCKVTVIAVTASSITLSAENLKLFVGQSAELTATVNPANTTNPQITWKTDNSAVATVTSEGKVVGVKSGTANITATCGTATATCVVTVTGNENVVVKPGDGTKEGDDRDTPAGNTDNGGSLIGNDLTLRVGQTAGIKVELPADLASNPTLTWTLATGGEQYVSMTPDANTLGATFKGLAMGKTFYTISLEGEELTGGNITVIAERPMTSLRLNPESIEMALNAPAVKITPEYTPSNASYTQLTWTSSNPNVAAVSNDGTVTPVGQGEAVITATANDGSGLTATCHVKVTAPIDGSFDFDFSDAAMGGVDGLTIYIGDTYQLKPKAQEGHVLPDNISWSSDNSSIVSVDSNGLIRGNALGTATITASATVNGNTVQATCKVTVIAVTASSITLSAENLKLFVGQSAELTATVNPANTTNPQITWTTDNAAVATVTSEGKVVGVKSGTANITATCGTATANCVVTVTGNENVVVKPGDGTTEGDEDDSPADNTGNGGSLIGNDLTLRVGQTAGIKVELPADLASNPTLTWTLATGGEQYVSMTPDANTLGATFKGLAMGKTSYTISLEGEELTGGNITVIAERPMTSLRLNPESIVMALNAPAVKITPEYTPSNASYTQLTWTSSNPNVATVSNDGTVTPVGQGEAVITATANDGSLLSANCHVKVTAPVDENFGFDFSDAAMGGIDALTIYIGDTYQLKPKAQEGYVLPENISWSCDNPAIVSVDDNGLIIGKGLGTATVTASATVNGNTVQATCKVTVIAVTASSITLSAENVKLFVGQSAELTATVYPANTTNPQITWTTDNAAVATVTSEGKVVGVKSGTANITATCGTATATCVVTVTGNENVVVKPGDGTTEGDEDDSPADNTENGGSLIGNDLTLRVGQTAGIKVELPADLASNPALTWTLATGGEQYVSMTPDANTLGATFKGLAMGKTSYTISLEGEELTGGNITVIAERPMTSLRLNPESIVMALNAPAVKITPEYTPSNASYTQLTWTSSNPAVATVSNDGTVTPVGQGETVITATANDGSLLSANCNVKVTAPVDGGFGFDFSDAAMGGVEGLTIYLGDTYQLKPKAQEGYELPENITWSSDNPSIVSVDSNGLIRGNALGTATITASATVNGNTVQATCKVTVIEVPCSEILLNTKDATIFIGETVEITATVKPDNVTNAVISWKSDNEEVASVSSSGVVTGLKEGTARIVASCGTVQAVAEITVKAIPASSIEMELRDITLPVGGTATLKAKVLPDNTTYPEIAWTTSDASVATIDAYGNLEAISPGMATITATCGNVSATCKITVTPVTASVITLNAEDLTLTVGATSLLKATVYPEETTYPELAWSSDNETVATITPEGLVTAIAPGVATITVRCDDATATCTVTVIPIEATSISLNIADQTIYVASTTTVTATVSPENATDKTITWSSDRPEIATVDENGTVLGVSAGETTITATCGNVSASCVITVIEREPPISLPFDDGADNDDLVGNNDGTTQDEDGWYERNGIHVSTLKTREGNDVGMWAEEPRGGYSNLWCYDWTINGEEIGNESHIVYNAAMAGGDAMEVDAQTPLVTFTNRTPEGDEWYKASAYGPTLEVYRRPQTPLQMTRKGDGTSHTFIVMMPVSNDMLVQLKYLFVYGYTDSEGVDHILETTGLRYCHTTAEIYNDLSCKFWAYSLWAYPDGSLVTSGLRYLDGASDEGFDASDFSGEESPLMNQGGATRTAIYTLDGHYRGTETERLVPGIYIQHTVKDGVSTAKKIIVH